MKNKNFLTLFIVLGLLISLLSVARSGASPGSIFQAAVTRTAVAPGATGTLSATSTQLALPALATPIGERPPQCTFPLAQTTAEESAPKEYAFSEPKVVLTADASIGIVEWLPDGQRVLITQDFRDKNRQTIEVFNPATGNRQVYAERTRMDQPPVWVEGLNAVLYPETKVIQRIPQSGTLPLIEFRRQLWMSQGNPQNAQPIEDVLLKGNSLSYISVSVEPQTHRILYFIPDEKRFVEQNERLDGKQALTLNLGQWEYRVKGNGLPIFYSMAWRPNTTQIFLYTIGDMGGYTFLLDVNTGKICEFDFKGWAGLARWSTNGRYLAIIRAWESLPINSSDLTVLDVVTGKQYVMKITPQELDGRHAILDITWAPDNRHLLAIGYVSPYSPSGQVANDKYSGLHLVDFISQENLHVLPKYKFFADWWGRNISWSPDGSQILVRCPISGIERLCNITVQETITNR